MEGSVISDNRMKGNVMSQEQHIQSQKSQALTQKPSKYQFVTGKMEKVLVSISTTVRRAMIKSGEKKNVRRKQALIDKVSLTDDQKREIKKFFTENYGKVMPDSWHRLYQSYTGKYRYDYFPEILLSTKLEPMLNPYREAEFFGDKNLLDTLFGTVEAVHIPKTYLSCIRGRIRSGEMEMIDREDAVALLANVGRCVIKKTTETNSGRDVAMCDLRDGVDTKSGMTISELMIQFGKDFIVQELVEQFAPLAALNESSLNTFRVMTYILDDKIYHCPVALRLGRAGAEKDNIHYGGICVGITEKGILRENAFSEMGDVFSEHPDSGVVFEGYEIPQFCKLIEAAHMLHARIPYLGLVSWDLSMDKNGVPVLIEMNTTRQSAWFCQMVNGESLFGENTANILKMIRT